MENSHHLPVATLGIYGDSLNPDTVSKLLGRTPTCGQSKGDIWISPSGKERTAGTGAWLLHSDAEISSHDINDHIAALLNSLAKTEGLLSLPDVEKASLTVALAVKEQPELCSLPPELLGRMSQLGISLVFEVYEID